MDIMNNELCFFSLGKVNGQIIISIDFYLGIICKKFFDYFYLFFCRKLSFFIFIDIDVDYYFVYKS